MCVCFYVKGQIVVSLRVIHMRWNIDKVKLTRKIHIFFISSWIKIWISTVFPHQAHTTIVLHTCPLFSREKVGNPTCGWSHMKTFTHIILQKLKIKLFYLSSEAFLWFYRFFWWKTFSTNSAREMFRIVNVLLSDI